MKKILVLTLIGLVFNVCFGQKFDSTHTIYQAYIILQKKENNIDRDSLKSISNIKLRDFKDIQTWQKVVKICDDAPQYNLLKSEWWPLMRFKSTDLRIRSEIVKLLEDDDRGIRIASIVAINENKIGEAIPKLREIVKNFSGTKHKLIRSTALTKEAIFNSYNYLTEAGQAAEALGTLGDLESIPLIVEKFNDLEHFSASSLILMGKEGVEEILKLARNESKQGNCTGICRTLYGVVSEELKPILLKSYFNKKEEKCVREMVTEVLLANFRDDQTVLNDLKKNYEHNSESDKSATISRCGYETDLDFLFWVIENDPDNALSAVERLGFVGLNVQDPKIVTDMLEKQLRSNDRNIRILAICSLLMINEKESMIRLKEYFIKNLGNVNNEKRDNDYLREIEFRLISGKKGIISNYELENN